MKTFFAAAMMILTAAICMGDGPSPAPATVLPNPGFEEGGQQWSCDDVSKVVPEAAHEGKMGLRVAAEKFGPTGSSAQSARLPVAPGQEVTLTFWARTKSDFMGVYLIFVNSGGKWMKNPAIRSGGGHASCGVKNSGDAWKAYTLKAKAPEGAAAVMIWIHAYGASKGTADLDDFAIAGIAPGAAPVAAPPQHAKAAAKSASAPTELPPRANPPVIILKLDDVRQVKGKVPGGWQKIAGYIESRHIKASFGIICQTLAEATPEYTKWIKDVQASGQIEFWFHGWDHGTHDVEGKKYNEFVHRPYEEQKKRMDDSQKLALEKLGFAFKTFGPPGGVRGASIDATTHRVMANDPYMKIWLYPMPLDANGKATEAAGKVTILDRVFEVNLESSVGHPDYEWFVTGYAKHPEREYFVLQGHPLQWSGDRFNEVVKIIDFLVAQKAVFMTPSEYVASLKK